MTDQTNANVNDQNQHQQPQSQSDYSRSALFGIYNAALVQITKEAEEEAGAVLLTLLTRMRNAAMIGECAYSYTLESLGVTGHPMKMESIHAHLDVALSKLGYKCDGNNYSVPIGKRGVSLYWGR